VQDRRKSARVLEEGFKSLQDTVLNMQHCRFCLWQLHSFKQPSFRQKFDTTSKPAHHCRRYLWFCEVILFLLLFLLLLEANNKQWAREIVFINLQVPHSHRAECRTFQSEQETPSHLFFFSIFFGSAEFESRMQNHLFLSHLNSTHH
jgi:hypothetical protein